MQRIVVDYNDYSHFQDPIHWGVSVGYEDAWQLTGYDLRDGSPALFVAPRDLEMHGVLRCETRHGKTYGYGEVDPSTQRDYVPVDMQIGSERARVTQRDDLMSVFHDGECVVLYDDDWEVYGTLARVEENGQTRWEGIPDWPTRRPCTDLPPAAWAKSHELQRAYQEAMGVATSDRDNVAGGSPGGAWPASPEGLDRAAD
jgi:hypothetical protein